MEETLHTIALARKINIPELLGPLSENAEIISCFEHSCEYGIFPYIDPDEREEDYNYWFPIYFDKINTGHWFVFLMNLHPNAKIPIYAGRAVYEGTKGTLHYYGAIKNETRVLPLPEDLEEYGRIKIVHSEIQIIANKGTDYYQEFYNNIRNRCGLRNIITVSDITKPIDLLYQLFQEQTKLLENIRDKELCATCGTNRDVKKTICPNCPDMEKLLCDNCYQKNCYCAFCHKL